ncbi:TPA: hypothetical protein BOS_22368 [Bos taurus]|nr:TPA: hypothetical protein BOS_22368 [Bos taurus]
MGLCHSLRPLLFGDPEPPVEGARSDLNPMPDLDLAPVRTPAQERRRRTDRQRAEEREARRVSKSIDRRLREQRRDLRRTHRLLLLGGGRPGDLAPTRFIPTACPRAGPGASHLLCCGSCSKRA